MDSFIWFFSWICCFNNQTPKRAETRHDLWEWWSQVWLPALQAIHVSSRKAESTIHTSTCAWKSIYNPEPQHICEYYQNGFGKYYKIQKEWAEYILSQAFRFNHYEPHCHHADVMKEVDVRCMSETCSNITNAEREAENLNMFRPTDKTSPHRVSWRVWIQAQIKYFVLRLNKQMINVMLTESICWRVILTFANNHV